MPSRRNQQVAYYNKYDAMKALEDVPLPDKIKCGRCNKYLLQKNYSKKQLADAKLKVKQYGPHAQYQIKCSKCTGQQVVEIECVICLETKGLEAFAKSQRADPSAAECFACTDNRLAQQPVNEELYNDDDRTKAILPTEEDVNTNWATPFDSSTITESETDWNSEELGAAFARTMTLSSSEQESLIETGHELGSQVENDEWQAVRTSSWHTKSNQTPSCRSTFDPHKYGKPSPRVGASTSGSLHTFSSGYAERDSSSFRKGWAKIKAYNPKQDSSSHTGTPAQEEEEDWSTDEEKAAGNDDDDDGSDTDTDI